ncbi:MAG: phosphoglucosamine mutase [Acidobacteria bacterium]|nr:phosphoglucosamine mutase [Acidobacteriota bacterium]
MRGEAYTFPLQQEIVQKIGFSAGKILGKEKGRTLVGCDTRESCDDIKEWLFHGLTKSGLDVYDCGVFPTPAVSAMTKEGNFDFGVVISASHNPYTDNGIKFFSQTGEKLNEKEEEEIESLIYELKETNVEKEKNIGKVFRIDLEEDYINYILERFGGLNLEKKTILLDTANGASFKIAPIVFSRLGANVKSINNIPDGKNINLKCGSLYAEELKRDLDKYGCEFGFSFDGDADRCLAVLPSGKILDGDFLLYNEAVLRKKKAKLKNNLVVGTVMSNFGLEKALEKEGISLFRAKVGDKYVYEALKEKGGEIGGEPSGHIIFLDKSPTGDGLITALSYCQNALEKGGMERLLDGIEMCFQKIVNIKVIRKVPLEELNGYKEVEKVAEDMVSGRGRIVLRYSGTEPLLRIMVEADNENILNETVQFLTKKLSSVLNEEV